MTRKEEKQALKEQKIKESIQNMREFSAKLQVKMNELVHLGREVANFGDEEKVTLVARQYAVVEDYKYRVDKMLLNIKIANKVKDIGTLTNEFFTNMKVMAKELGRLSNDRQLTGVAKGFSKSAEMSEIQVLRADDMISKTQDMFTSMQDISPNSADYSPKNTEREDKIIDLFKGKASAVKEQKQAITADGDNLKLDSVDDKFDILDVEAMLNMK